MKVLNYKARVTEVGEVGNQLVALYKRTATVQDEVFLGTLFQQIEAQTNALTEAVNKGIINSKLEEADAKRDDAFRVLGKLLDAYKVFPDAATKASGEKVSAVFNRYGLKITNESYLNETNLIDALLMDFQAAEIKSAIDGLAGVKDAVSTLSAAQEEFRSVQNTYQDDKAKHNTTESASTLRKPLLDLINKQLMPYLTALQMANKEKYAAFVQSVETIFDNANRSIKGRSAKATDKPSTEKNDL